MTSWRSTTVSRTRAATPMRSSKRFDGMSRPTATTRGDGARVAGQPHPPFGPAVVDEGGQLLPVLSLAGDDALEIADRLAHARRPPDEAGGALPRLEPTDGYAEGGPRASATRSSISSSSS